MTPDDTSKANPAFLGTPFEQAVLFKLDVMISQLSQLIWFLDQRSVKSDEGQRPDPYDLSTHQRFKRDGRW